MHISTQTGEDVNVQFRNNAHYYPHTCPLRMWLTKCYIYLFSVQGEQKIDQAIVWSLKWNWHKLGKLTCSSIMSIHFKILQWNCIFNASQMCLIYIFVSNQNQSKHEKGEKAGRNHSANTCRYYCEQWNLENWQYVLSNMTETSNVASYVFAK